jgi:hypothetical protein
MLPTYQTFSFAMSYTGGPIRARHGRHRREAFIAWRADLVEAVNDLVARFPTIRESQELADLKTILETGF